MNRCLICHAHLAPGETDEGICTACRDKERRGELHIRKLKSRFKRRKGEKWHQES